MTDVSVIGNAVVGNVRAATPTTPTNSVEVMAPTNDNSDAVAIDRVEFSEQAQMLEKIHQLPEVRQDRIDAIKEAIESNSYLTNDKLDLAIMRMIDDVV